MDKEYKKFLRNELHKMIPQRTPEERAACKRFATLCSHVSRRLHKNERLTGNVLDLALSAVNDEKTSEKLRNGGPLTEYEKHLIVDVVLLHMRLAS
ncbi:hypothetical protein AB8A05_29635 [Tardiphaga sp. 538_B7_N1_4]|uniref:hypothetical protein n=1 Tax=Tardiphaga sp. 538_B7_N1_4 TaxID=3240778 RepID=UPI003F2376F0